MGGSCYRTEWLSRAGILIDKSATVKAYKIVEAEYGENGASGLIGYKAVDGVTLAKAAAPTGDELNAIANAISDGTLTLTPIPMSYDRTKEGFTASVNAGSYLVIATGVQGTVYNPMVVSASYTTADGKDTLTGGTLDIDSNDQKNLTLKDGTTQPKKSGVTIDKEIVSGDSTKKGDDLAVGDIATFKITTSIPSYSPEYKNVEYKITDTLSGLKFVDGTAAHKEDTVKDGQGKAQAISIQIGGKDYDLAEGELTLEDNKITLNLTSENALAHKGQKVVITYTAQVTNDAKVNFDPHTNTANVEFSNDPSDSSKKGKKEDKTYHYTFGIDANLMGESTSTTNKETRELIKIGEDGETKTIKTPLGKEVTVSHDPLEGAEFSLTNKTTGRVYTATSGEDGQLTFKGLDAGEYTLQETKAPAGYTLNTTTVPVKITATYNTDGTLASYSITVNKKNTSTYTATYTTAGDPTTVTFDKTNVVENPYGFANTKMTELPSTGGMGTRIFTIGGAALVILAGIALMRRRRTNA